MHLSAFTVQQRRAFAVGLICLVVLLVVWRHHGAHPAAAASLQVAPLMPKAATRTGAGSSRLVVDVAGAVRHPGLVRVPHGARVADAIAQAGGLTPGALRDAVNLAAPVADGQQVLVPARGSLAAAGDAGTGTPASGGPVSLSTASAEQLDALPGVGPITAQKIVTYRQQHGPFTSIEGLDAISGIGPSRIADLKGLVVP
jgi:competence protein ComEA